MSAGWQWPAALQGVPNAEGSFFQYILSQTPHYEKKKKIMGSFWVDSLSSLSQTHLNTSKHPQTP